MTFPEVAIPWVTTGQRPRLALAPRLEVDPTTTAMTNLDPSNTRSRPGSSTEIRPRVLGALLSLCFAASSVGQEERTERGPHWSLLPSREPAERLAGFQRVTDSGSRADIPVLRDLLRFAETADEWYRILDAGSAVLGENLRAVQGPWRTLTVKMAADPEWPEHPDYGAFKAELYAQQVDPRMRDFFERTEGARIRLNEIVWGGVEVDGIPALDEPRVLAAADADDLDETEPVFGVSIDGLHRAYPLRILDWHEMANDRLGRVSFALAYCTLCGAGIVYRTDVEDRDGNARVLRFGSSGLLMRSNKLMFDRHSKSLWNQFTGEPVLGPAVGRYPRLEVLPSVVTTWGAWVRRHPDTDVLSTATGFDRDYSLGASYGAYFGSETMMFPASGRDPERFPKERVFVIRGVEPAVVLSLDVLRRDGVVPVEASGMDLQVLCPDLPVRAAIPQALRSVLEELERPVPDDASGLTAEDLETALGESRAFLADLEVDFLLALPVAVRLPFLRSASEPADPAQQRLPSVTRNLVALRGLAGEVMAFKGDVRIERRVETDGTVRFVDPDGRPFEILPGELVGPADSDGDRARLPRVGGHLAFRFGVEAFLERGDPVGTGR